MKKIILLIFMILVVVTTFGQSLQKGNLIGLHTFSLNLDPDVTFNQYKDFFIQKYIPELDKHYPDVKHYFFITIKIMYSSVIRNSKLF